jgi:carbon-monoxide dehydrogenase medium subunit
VSSPSFIRPESIEEATELLRLYDGEAKIVAGSTAMTIMLRQQLIAPEALIPIGHLPGMRDITVVDDHLVVGALVTHREMELSPLVRQTIPVVAHVFGEVANIRIRNAATVGGVLAEADYASDPPCVLVGIGAKARTFSTDGERVHDLSKFFLAFYETELHVDEIVTSLLIPIPPAGTFATYKKYKSRSAEDRPCVGVFASARRADDGTFADVRVCVGAAAETPQHRKEIDALAEGTSLDDVTCGRIADAYADVTDALDDMRGSAWYRKEMVRVWVRRALADVQAAATDSQQPIARNTGEEAGR